MSPAPPAHLWIPLRVGSYGDEAADLMALAGRQLDEAQCLALDAMLSYGPGGRWAALESALIEPRQNGKTSGPITGAVLFDLFLLPPDKISWSAHLFKTTRESFEDIRNLIDGCAELSRRVKKVREANGEEGIELHSGAELNFLARSKGGGRGLGGKRIVMDEALFLLAAMMDALFPILSARSMHVPGPHVHYASSAPLDSSEQLHAVVKRGRDGGDDSLAYVEHKAPGSWAEPTCVEGKRCSHAVGVDGCALDDEASIAAANPAYRVRISPEYVRGERKALTPRGFGRERLGWEDPLAIVARWQVIGEAEWRDLMDVASEIAGSVTLGVAVAHDRSSACIGAAGAREDGRWHVEVPATKNDVLDHRAGTDWLLPRLVEVWESGAVSAVVVNPKSPAGYLVADLEAEGVRVLKPGPDDLTSTFARFTDACKPEHDKLRHRGQVPLTSAVRAAAQRKVGDRWTWDLQAPGGDVTPLVACADALWGHLQSVDVMPLVTWR